jgi:hypothetical protein
MARLPARRSSKGEIDTFLKKSRDITQFQSRQPRLLFAIDATASRQPTWDTACQQQQAMFQAVAKTASLRVQLCYYRGFNEFCASPWLDSSERLASTMGQVYCEGGHTQIARLLRHALSEHNKAPIRAMVFIGDAVEENPDTLCQLAGQCGLLRFPLFMFQEGRDGAVETCFRQMSKLSGGAYARFDQHSASALAALLGAAASFAAGGRAALEKQGSESAKLLLKQLNH